MRPRGYPLAMRSPPRPSATSGRASLLAAGAAILYGAAYPATAVALRSFTPLAIAGLACTIALPVRHRRRAARPHPAAVRAGLEPRRASLRLVVLAVLGGLGFIAAVNIAVSLSGPTVTGFIAPLYAVAAALFAVPILGERVRPVTVGGFVLALVGTALLAGVDPTPRDPARRRDGRRGRGHVRAVHRPGPPLGRRYALDGTLVTIANLIGRGPILLAFEWLRAPGTLIPAEPGPGGGRRAAHRSRSARARPANLLLMASVRRVPAGRTSAALLLTPISSAVIAAVVLGERLDADRAGRRGADPRRDRRRERAARSLVDAAPRRAARVQPRGRVRAGGRRMIRRPGWR